MRNSKSLHRKFRTFIILSLLAAFLCIRMVYIVEATYSVYAMEATEKEADDAKEIVNSDLSDDITIETTGTVEEEKSKSFAEKVADKLSALPDELVCFVISMVPIIELRGGLIVAAIKGITLWKAIAICIAGNLVPIPFILLLIRKIFELLKKTKTFRPLVEKLEAKSMSKSEKIKKYEFLGLVLFVGIPLPGTGGWTGSLIAALMNIKLKKAFPAICLGLIMATIIMCFITYGIPWLVKYVF